MFIELGSCTTSYSSSGHGHGHTGSSSRKYCKYSYCTSTIAAGRIWTTSLSMHVAISGLPTAHIPPDDGSSIRPVGSVEAGSLTCCSALNGCGGAEGRLHVIEYT